MIFSNSLLYRLKNLKKYRSVVNDFDPDETILITYSNILPQAVNYCISKNEKFPKFCLVDIEENRGEYTYELINKHHIELIPLHNIILNLEHKYILLYSEEVPNMWDKNAFWNLAFLMHNYNVSDRYRIANESIVKFEWKRKPDHDYVIKNIDKLVTIYNFLEDEASKHIFLSAIKCISTGDAGYLPISRYKHYDHPHVRVKNTDYVLEGGLGGGHTTKFFSNLVGPSGMIYGFEALHKHYETTKKYLSTRQNTIVENLGLWSCEKDFYIQDKGGASKMVSKDLGNAEKCHSTTIDRYIKQKNIKKCDCIKLDIEGAEMECLKGSYNTIRRYRPKLMISLYHMYEHYKSVPLWIKSNFPEYKVFIGHHSPWYGETCLYAYCP